MRDRYDVIVVGARVAGSTLAALLGDAGASVLLVDGARFPSTTPSTHFFRGAGLVAVLERLGVLEQALALGSPPLTRQFDYEDGGPDAADGPPQGGRRGRPAPARRMTSRRRATWFSSPCDGSGRRPRRRA